MRNCGASFVPEGGPKMGTKSLLTRLCVNILLVPVFGPLGGPETGVTHDDDFEPAPW